MSSLSISKRVYISESERKEIETRQEEAEEKTTDYDRTPYYKFRNWMKRKYGYRDFIITDGLGKDMRELNLGWWIQ